MWTTREEREEAKTQAMDQISAKFKEAGVEIPGNLITDVVQRITVLGPHEGRHKLMSEQVEEAEKTFPRLKDAMKVTRQAKEKTSGMER